jgi:hypothetical protein
MMAEVDHTSGVMRCRYEVIGGHVHCDVFGPYSGRAGSLIFRVREWGHFQQMHPNWQFAETTRCVHPSHEWVRTDERGVNVWRCTRCGEPFPAYALEPA